jgi:hypothetical protein
MLANPILPGLLLEINFPFIPLASFPANWTFIYIQVTLTCPPLLSGTRILNCDRFTGKLYKQLPIPARLQLQLMKNGAEASFYVLFVKYGG